MSIKYKKKLKNFNAVSHQRSARDHDRVAENFQPRDESRIPLVPGDSQAKLSLGVLRRRKILKIFGSEIIPARFIG